MAFSPVKASKVITEQYKRYLATIFSLNDPVYEKQFLQQLHEPKSFAAGPYLEVSDTFASADTTRELVEQGQLPKGFLRLGFYHDRPLYRHQKNAITEILNKKNVVVTTGTGSGKTESFLVPIMSALVQEYEQGTLSNGVRALLIYPMNALANDQVEKLRFILRDFPQITFGCYTGQTKEKQREALWEYQKLNHGEKPIPSELISREQMKQTPPHILITNYAMLEYLMLRPEDAVFFRDNTWRFVVLDEAHVYRGSTGIEVSMLLRRLNAALSGCSLQYILTSATLGNESENLEVAQFARELCNSSFDAEHVIRAKRVSVPEPEKPLEVPATFYDWVLSRQNQGIDVTQLNQEILSQYPLWELRNDQPLFDVVHRDNRYWLLRNVLRKPCSFMDLPKKLGIQSKELEDFVSVAAQCEADGIRLLDARYHMFLRATESVFITLAPDSRLFLTRRSKYTNDNGQVYAVFEISTCNICHAIYLVGKVENDYLVQSAEDSHREVFYLVTSRILRTFVGTRAPSSSRQMIFPDSPSRSTRQAAKQPPPFTAA